MEQRHDALLLVAPLLMIALVFTSDANNTAFGQSSSSANPAQIKECRQLGIKLEDCSDQTILSTRCIGPNKACNDINVPPMDVNVSLIPICLGIAGAFVASILYVKNTRRWKIRTR